MQHSIDRYRRTKGKTRNRKSVETQAIMICVAVGLIVVVVLGMFVLYRGGPSSDRREQSARRSSKKSASARGPERRSFSWRGGAPIPSGPRTLADLMDQPDDVPIETDTVTAQLEAARRTMSQRDLKTARRHVHSAIDLARSPTEREEVDRAQKLLESLETFWRAVQREAARLRSGQELPLEDTRVIVVNYDDGVLTVRASGQIRLFTIADMPRPLALELAERGIPKGAPNRNLHIGSFLAVDAQGDRQQARRLWQEAGEPGKTLMPELDLAPPVKAPEGEQPASGLSDAP